MIRPPVSSPFSPVQTCESISDPPRCNAGIAPNIGTPESQHRPAASAQLLINEAVVLTIPLELSNPERRIRFGGDALFKPIPSVPEVSVRENRQPSTGEYEVRCSMHSPIVAGKTQSEVAECVRETILHVRSPRPDPLHVPSPYRGIQVIRHSITRNDTSEAGGQSK